MRELFGEAGLANESTRYDVSVDPEERNVLMRLYDGTAVGVRTKVGPSRSG